VKVWFSTHLRAYTGGAETEVDAPTVLAVVDELERRHPGFKFRILDEHDQIREHIIIFRNKEQVRDLRAPVAPTDHLRMMGALSGG
jgi:molybdopterin converting factor small subunit